jgi:hypothetical protein
METRPVGAALINTDRRKDITKLKGDFRDHANAPLKEYHCQEQTQDITLIHTVASTNSGHYMQPNFTLSSQTDGSLFHT